MGQVRRAGDPSPLNNNAANDSCQHTATLFAGVVVRSDYLGWNRAAPDGFGDAAAPACIASSGCAYVTDPTCSQARAEADCLRSAGTCGKAHVDYFDALSSAVCDAGRANFNKTYGGIDVRGMLR